MSVREFAAHLGVSDRMVSKWEAGGEAIRPRPLNQAALDTSLALASADVKSRFTHIAVGHDARAPHQRQLVPTDWPEGPCHIVRHPLDGKLMTMVDSGPYHPTPAREPVWLQSYYIDLYPTTNADYARFLKATGHQPPPDLADRLDQIAGTSVVEVGFEDACAYAHWAAKSIPTTDEWDRAARGIEGMIVIDLWEWCRTESGPSRRGRKGAAGGGFRCTSPASELLSLLAI